MGLTALLALLTAVALSAPAVAIDLPGAPGPETGSPAPPLPAAGPAPAAAPAPATAPVAAPVTRRVAPKTLRVGYRGGAVRVLQRELRRRGQRYVRIDGAFGPNTRRAVRVLQKRMRMPVTGVATPAFQRRLGIQSTVVASAPRLAVGVTLGARYLRAFPVLGDYTYSDDYGAPRHQGSHEGTDVMAARGTPVVAVADGVILRLTRAERGLGGLYIWLRDGEGNEYYYAHLASIATGLDAGSRVAVGQVIGQVGNTGDARHTAPHLHFEIHPGGGRAVNPYSELRAVDPKVRAR